MNQSRFTVFGIDIHLGTIVERHNCNYIAAVLAGGGNTKLASPISGRHRLREKVVTVTYQVRNVGMRTTLEDSNLFTITCFDGGAGQVRSVIFVFSRPDIPYLSFLQRHRLCACFATFSLCCQIIIHSCFSIFDCNDGKVATLRFVLMIRRRIRLN